LKELIIPPTSGFHSGDNLATDELVIAVGSKPKQIWLARSGFERGFQGLYSKQDLELMESALRPGVSRAVIVGGD